MRRLPAPPGRPVTAARSRAAGDGIPARAALDAVALAPVRPVRRAGGDPRVAPPRGRLMGTDRTGLRSASFPYAAQQGSPVRTCVGCRRPDSWLVLVRVVAIVEAGQARLVPDVRHRLPGRGAWLHPETACLEVAVRKRAFGRALRLQVPADAAALTAYLRDLVPPLEPTMSEQPQGGLDADEHAMSTQQ